MNGASIFKIINALSGKIKELFSGLLKTNIKKLSSSEDINEYLPSFPDQAINASLTHDPDVIRIPEQTMRIWVAPYKNNSDEYVDAFHMHIVTQDGHWHSK